MNQTIEIIPWDATESSTCPVDLDTVVTVWYRGGGTDRDTGRAFLWDLRGSSTITHYAITPDELFKPKRWRAEVGKLYFTLEIREGKLNPIPSTEFQHALDSVRYDRGVYFQTLEQAQQLADEINALIAKRANA